MAALWRWDFDLPLNKLVALNIGQAPFTRYNLLSDPFDNPLYRVYSRLSNRLYNPVWEPVERTALNEQWPFVQQGCQTGWQPVCQTDLTTGWMFVYTIQLVDLYNRFQNRLYRVNGVSVVALFLALVCVLGESAFDAAKLHIRNSIPTLPSVWFVLAHLLLLTENVFNCSRQQRLVTVVF